MTKKSKQILIDTVVIIDAHEHGYWETLCNAYSVLLPATILEDEAFYFQSDRGKIGMKPTEWIKQAKVTRIEPELEDFVALQKRLSPDFMASLDKGELEALAILGSKNHKEIFLPQQTKRRSRPLGFLDLALEVFLSRSY